MAQPQWATKERQHRLVQLAVAYKGRCLKGHRYCQDVEHYVQLSTTMETAAVPTAIGYQVKQVPVQKAELSDLYGMAEERATEDWKQEDRDLRLFERQRIQQPAPTGEVGRFGRIVDPNRRRRYDPIEVDGHVNNRPSYYLMGYSVDGQMRRHAKVRIPGMNIILQVDVSESLQEVSQRKRKWLRKNGIAVKTAEALIADAVATWWRK